jgi:hypothetical protein
MVAGARGSRGASTRSVHWGTIYRREREREGDGGEFDEWTMMTMIIRLMQFRKPNYSGVLRRVSWY